ncbi:uncharacterized protein CcaverHIS019_0600820 [Cutaneotrichosporon cavernicola]|uniref:Uncharacterized protein n=1 Tax=Cutaneotrichosporon cavernicola TaxID=279322 RepID=A0AA48L7Y5_9TREE|nr:uncharacterized protein CcaverHIS019_0600820 [Cutaneotrichosporon cavernicola]BEI93623.1 hypothetical protein CcaverHIS019_0600820 [Cutaneotrichosporon cavernicola]BEJ01400.1 hypothetical protein CcaverHIS631_0600820 [Cutaneotrichosporon cavernicola]BEJ09167.1 hypothetical protein CcaverHIS641_0600820 [Cutaneotrichosporon cavernicola]
MKVKITSPKLSLGYKRNRRWGWSGKPAPTAMRNRATALLDVVTVKKAVDASTSTNLSSPTLWNPYMTPPRTTVPRERLTRSPAPSPSTASAAPTAWMQPPEPALRTLLASRGINRAATNVAITRDEWTACAGESSTAGAARLLSVEACLLRKDHPTWTGTIRRGIIAAAESACVHTAVSKVQAEVCTPPKTSATMATSPFYQPSSQPTSPVYQPPSASQSTSPFFQPSSHPSSPVYQPPSHPSSPVYQPPSHPSSPVYQPPSHPTSPVTTTHTSTNTSTGITIPIPPRLIGTPYAELPSPVPGITRVRPPWTRPGGPLPPFLTQNDVPADFEEHRWNMAYVVHEVAGLEWHEECLCMDCDDTALSHAQHLPKIWPGREVVNPFLVAYFNGN